MSIAIGPRTSESDSNALLSCPDRLAAYALQTTIAGSVAIGSYTTLVGKLQIACGPIELRATDPTRAWVVFVALVLLRILMQIGGKERLLLAAGTIASLLLGEVGLRVLDHPWARTPRLGGVQRASVRTGWELIPGLECRTVHGHEVRINSGGFRGPEVPRARGSESLRVAVLGDSFAFGTGVAKEQIIPRQLERALRASGSHPDTLVLNFGVPGFNALQSLRTLEDRALGYDPDVVVYLAFFNDLDPPHDEEQIAQEYVERSLRDQGSRALSTSYLLSFLRNSHLMLYELPRRGRRGHDIARWLRSVQDRSAVVRESDAGATLSGDWDHGWLFEKIGRMRALTREAGARFQVALVPDVVQLANPRWKALNRQLAEFCAGAGIPLTDTTSQLEASGLRPEELYNLPWDVHTSPAANRIIGDAIAATILDSTEALTSEP